jgi:UDP-N-acetylmuramate dehydrogenase
MPSWREPFFIHFPQAKPDEPMALHTTFRIGGPADAYLEIQSFVELEPIFSFAKKHKVPVTVLGWGSNLLVLDGGIRGIVLRLRGEFEKIEFLVDCRVRAGAGVRLPTFVTACAEKGMAGAESLVGVPGTIGGALVMNAGTREGEIGTLVRAVRYFDLDRMQESWIEARKILFTYRHSSLDRHVLLGAEFGLKLGDKVDILERVKKLQERRQKTQPIHTYNVGSTFKNPQGCFVAQMIEQAGLKGLHCGGAKVSEKHANFFENAGNATAKDVLALVDRVRAEIRQRFGMELELEMKVVGEA